LRHLHIFIHILFHPRLLANCAANGLHHIDLERVFYSRVELQSHADDTAYSCFPDFSTMQNIRPSSFTSICDST